MNENLYMGEVGLAELWSLMTAYVDGRIFVGTRAEYEAKASEITVGTMVIITDESDVVIPPVEDAPADSTIAILGTALLGSMILGQS